jgi:hypothetical protein
MPICRSFGACETWGIEYYKHPAPLALRSEDADSNELLFAQSSFIPQHLLPPNHFDQTGIVVCPHCAGCAA